MGNGQTSFGKFVPAIAFLLIAALGLTLAWTIHASGRARDNVRLVAETIDIAGDIEQRMAQYMTLLRATRAVVETAGPGVFDGKLADFTGKLDLEGVYAGIQGLGYATLIPVGSEAAAAARFRLEAPIRPETNQPVRTPIVFLTPRNERNAAAMGYDMYSEPVRRAAMDAAARADRPIASAPVILRQEITEDIQTGFLIFLAARNPAGEVVGYVYATFRAADMVGAAIGRERTPEVALRIEDVESATTLYERGAFDRGRGAAQTTITVAERNWRVLTTPTHDVWGGGRLVTPTLVAIGALLLGAVFAVAYREQQRSEAAARQLASERARMLEDRELLMQEMNHRLKNSIARISSIARSSARNADGLAAFLKSFMGRLDAMAAAQDALTRSRWEKARLGDILANELAQAFSDASLAACEGPDVDLNERQAQAFGLIFHELTTNAAKYGAARVGGSISVSWRLENGAVGLDWVERSPQAIPPRGQSAGFGSKLIDALVTGELKGAVTRRFEDDGLKICISARLGA